MHTVHEYQLANAVDLASALTRAVTSALHAAITARGRASLVVSGGRTPVLLFNQLAQQQLDWRRVVITLADERWVRADATTSNENLVRRELLRDHAVAAQFVGMMSAADTLASGAEAAWRAWPLSHDPSIACCSGWATMATPPHSFPQQRSLMTPWIPRDPLHA